MNKRILIVMLIFSSAMYGMEKIEQNQSSNELTSIPSTIFSYEDQKQKIWQRIEIASAQYPKRVTNMLDIDLAIAHNNQVMMFCLFSEEYSTKVSEVTVGFRDYLTCDVHKNFYISFVKTSHPYQRQGYAFKLLQEVLSFLKTVGAQQVHLRSYAYIISLYEKLGFYHIKRSFINGVVGDVYSMCKDLD